MKKILLVLGVLFSFSLAGCTDDKTENSVDMSYNSDHCKNVRQVVADGGPNAEQIKAHNPQCF